jgi:hypothetical protein
MTDSAVEPSSLYSLVYTSTASRPLAKSDLEHILDKARTRNLEEQVTGLLLFTEGKFMQYLEGPQSGVLKIFDIIKKSSLHGQIAEVSRQAVGTREYGDWSMAFLADVDAHSLPRSADDASLVRDLEAETTDASTAGHAQLADFWKKS